MQHCKPIGFHDSLSVLIGLVAMQALIDYKTNPYILLASLAKILAFDW